MFLALYLHPVKYNAEKRKKKIPHTSTALSADAASGPSILNLMSAADVSFACKQTNVKTSYFRDLQTWNCIGSSSSSESPPRMLSSGPGTLSHVTCHAASHTSRSPEGGGALTLLCVPLGPPRDQALGLATGLLAPHHRGISSLLITILMKLVTFTIWN